MLPRRAWTRRLPFLIALSLAAGAFPLFAQVAAGELTGVVTAQAGATIPGVPVAVTNIETNRQRVVLSTTDGVYTAPSLAPGAYRIDVELSGFRPIHRSGIRLSTGEKARIDLVLA